MMFHWGWLRDVRTLSDAVAVVRIFASDVRFAIASFLIDHTSLGGALVWQVMQRYHSARATESGARVYCVYHACDARYCPPGLHEDEVVEGRFGVWMTTENWVTLDGGPDLVGSRAVMEAVAAHFRGDTEHPRAPGTRRLRYEVHPYVGGDPASEADVTDWCARELKSERQT